MAATMRERIMRIGATRRARPKGFPGWQRIVSVERVGARGNDMETAL